MSGNTGERIPRMRTAAKIVAEIKALDPGTEVTEYHIRQLVKDGALPIVWAGRKALINLDDVLELLRDGDSPARSGGRSRRRYPACQSKIIRYDEVNYKHRIIEGHQEKWRICKYE